MIPPIPQVVLLFGLVGAFVHFLVAGARTFSVTRNDDTGVGWAQVSFVLSGALTVGFLGLRTPIRPVNGIASALVLVSSLGLYEWARHTIWGRRFPIAWSGRVPDSVCNSGPYQYVRHPIYGSYILAFLAALVAMPSLVMLACFLFNVALFAHAARSDERSLEQSRLAAEYGYYKRVTGMFVPRILPASTVDGG